MSSQQAPAVTPEKIMQYAWAYAPPLIIEAAIHNCVFDTLASGPMAVAAVSAATGASVRGLASIMNALTGLGLLTRTDDGIFALTPESAAFLVSTKPSFLGGLYKHMSRQLIPSWLSLSDVVRTGKPPRGVHGDADASSEFFQQFVADIFPLSYGPARVAAEALGLRTLTAPYRVLDVGAGSGVWGIAFAQASPHVEVTALDWPKVLDIASGLAERFGVAGRFHRLEGDLRTTDLGAGYQAATIGHILHGEGAVHSRDLLRRVFDALAPGGSVVIAEFLVSQDRRGPAIGLLFGVTMLVNTEEGDTFSFEEIAAWLTEAGFVNARMLECESHSPLILADKPLS